MAELQYSIENVDPTTHRREIFGPGRAITTGHNVIDLGTVRAAKGNLSEGGSLDNPIALALQPMQLTKEEGEEMRAFIAHGTAYPTIPTRRIPEGDRSLLKREQQ